MTEDEVVAQLRSGMTIGIGGWGSRRKPMSLVRAILNKLQHPGNRLIWTSCALLLLGVGISALRAAEPSPPRTMITNERIRNGRPKSGLNEYKLARSAPANPPNAMPKANVVLSVRPAFTPTIRPA